MGLGRPNNNPYDADREHFASAATSRQKSLSSIGGSSSSHSRSPSQQSVNSDDLGVIYSSDSGSARRDRSRSSRHRKQIYYTGNSISFSDSSCSLNGSPERADPKASIIRIEVLPKQQVRTKPEAPKRRSSMSQHGLNVLLSKENSAQMRPNEA